MAVWSVARKQEIEKWHRLDAEFWRPEYQEVDKLLSKWGSVEALGSVAKRMRKGIFYILADEYVEHGVPFLRVSNVKCVLLDVKDLAYISGERNRRDAKTCFKRGDIVLSKTGDIGAAVIGLELCNISQDLIGVEIADQRKFRSYYITTFLNTRYGQLQLRRWMQGQVQMHLALTDARKILVPFPSQEEQDEVEQIVLRAEAEARDSEGQYAEAERIVLEELEWDSIDLSQPMWWAVPLSRVQEVRRLDAEHFQPRYDRVIDHLKSTGKAKPLAEIANHVRRGVQPRYVEDGDVLVINSRHVGKQRVNVEQAERTDDAFWQQNSNAQAKKYDVIMNSTGVGTIGRTNCVLHDRKTVVDNHVTIIRTRKGECNPVYLAVYLNSPPGLMQTDRWLSGSSGQIELYPAAIKRFLVYLPADQLQKEVATLVERSHQARERARALLDEAKAKVEELIGEGSH